ncbi:MAG: AIR synthase related protein [Candidatus Altiarchaeota archaeon]|nr:AIR synthase related protein [Candidatus Altiarchaeota archaeon]
MDIPDEYRGLIERHVTSLDWLRSMLLEMDSLAKPVLGIKAWDDSVVMNFGGSRLVASVDGPYSKRLVMKSALIHAATDVVVKGGKPLFALDTLIGDELEIREMITSLKNQSLAMGIPILGGNTMLEDSEPKCSLTVVGELLLKEPIRDCNAREGDFLVLIGEPIWGSRGERILKAKKLFEAWFRILEKGIVINAAKDVTKGGLISTIYEVCYKSGRDYSLEKEIPFSMTRNLDNFLVSVPEESYRDIVRICGESDCEVHRVGGVK